MIQCMHHNKVPFRIQVVYLFKAITYVKEVLKYTLYCQDFCVLSVLDMLTEPSRLYVRLWSMKIQMPKSSENSRKRWLN